MPVINKLDIHRDAMFSADRKYRYLLHRSWRPAGKLWLMVMLNPSVADHNKDDATTRFCMNRAVERDYGSYEAVNLFALIGTDPNCLVKEIDPVGSYNNEVLLRASERADIIICAWGALAGLPKHLHARIPEVLNILHGKSLYCFGLTNEGHPRFPRAISRNIELLRFA